MRFWILMLVMVLMLTSCRGGSMENYNPYEGQNGLVPEFASNAPPDAVYENTPFPVKLGVHNMGAANVHYDDLLITFSGDPLYINIPVEVQQYEPTIHDPESELIRGRSLGWPDGEKKIFSVPAFYSFFVKPVYGTRQKPETDLAASICYKYNTLATSDVCIDTNVYYANEREQPCVQQDVSFSNGQGAPITVTDIEVQSFPVVDNLLGTESIRPHFTIHFRDVGDGRLIGPASLPMDTACFLKGIPSEQINTVKLDAWLLGTKLECQPGELIKMFDGEGVARCTVPSNNLNDPIYASKQNFQSVLIVNLTYMYKTATTKTLEVNRIPGTERPDITPNDLEPYGKETGVMYQGEEPVVDDYGTVYTECRYYAENPDKAPSEIQDRINPEFSCSCSRDACLALASSGKCIVGLCRPGTYCCDKTRETTVSTNRIGQIALDEYNYFGGRSECDSAVSGRVADYFRAGGCSGTCGGTPWSAAYISYVMGKSGVNFPRSCNHWEYFTKVRGGEGSCRTLRVEEVSKIKVGDIVCNCRGSSCPISYTDPYAPGVTSHCDIITSIEGDKVEIVGGNVGNTVAKRTVSRQDLVVGDYFGFISC